MNFENIEKYMDSKGYTIHSYDDSRTIIGFINNKHIHATVYRDTKLMKLDYLYDLFTISTGYFQFIHPNFEKLFEVPLIELIDIINEYA